jgi:hypothetical protein
MGARVASSTLPFKTKRASGASPRARRRAKGMVTALSIGISWID